MILGAFLMGAVGLISALAVEKLPWVGESPSEARKSNIVRWYVGLTLLGVSLGAISAGGTLNAPMVISIFGLLLTGALDLRYRLVFPAVVAVFVAAILLAWGLTDSAGFTAALVGAVVAGILLLFLYLLAALLYGFGALGSGDIFVGALIGASLGWPLAVVGILCGAFAGGVWAVWALIRGAGRRGYIAYGAALCYGSSVVLAGKWMINGLPGLSRWLGQLETLLVTIR